MQKKILAAVVVVVLAVLGWYLLSGKQRADAPAAPEQQQSTGDLQNPPRGAQVGGPVTWAVRPITEIGETDPPTTEVIAITSAGRESLGVQDGTCTSIEDSDWDLLEGEVSGVICYWAGAGVEFGAFSEGDGYVIKKGTIEEGSAEVPGGRGGFETIMKI